MRRVTIGLAASANGKATNALTPDGARKIALQLQAQVIQGKDPQGRKAADRKAETVTDVATAFLAEHVDLKRKAGTALHYRDILERLVLPELGRLKAAELQRAQVSKLHRKIGAKTPFQANRTIAVVSSMMKWAEGAGIVPEGFSNPARGIDKFSEAARGDKLSTDQLERLGDAIREAQTVGIPWKLDPEADHRRLRKDDRVTRIDPHAAAALLLLIFSGARLREILHLRWSDVDFERGLLLIRDHKTSRTAKAPKMVILNAPALAILQGIERIGVYVIAGASAGKKGERPRADLRKPWVLVRDRAELDGVRLHDLRHNFASFGVGGGMGLPLIGKLLGHAQATTTARYAHLDSDPLRRAANTIGAEIAAAMGMPINPNEPAKVVAMSKGRKAS